MSKKNIYKTQMEKLGLNDIQYSQLTGIPLKLLRKLLRNEKVSDNMSLNDFFRKNVSRIHQELETNNVETVSKAIEIKMNDQKEEEKLLEWYENEFNKETLMEKYNCPKEARLFYSLPIKVEPRYKEGKRMSNSEFISMSTYERLLNKEYISKKFLLSILPQLYEYYTNENIDIPKIDIENRKREENKENENKYIKWWNEFNIQEWLVENGIPVKRFTEEAHIGHASYYYIVNNKITPTTKTIKKIKEYVENSKGKEEMKNKKSELRLWFDDFDIRGFLEKNKIDVIDFIKEIDIASSTAFALLGKKSYYNPSDEILKKVKRFVENHKVEPIEILNLEEPIETKEIKPLESFQIGNVIVEPKDNGVVTTVTSNNEESVTINSLKELIKERLTESEKSLIRLFGGKI